VFERQITQPVPVKHLGLPEIWVQSLSAEQIVQILLLHLDVGAVVQLVFDFLFYKNLTKRIIFKFRIKKLCRLPNIKPKKNLIIIVFFIILIK